MMNVRCAIRLYPLVLSAIAGCAFGQAPPDSKFTQQGPKLYGTGATGPAQQGYSVAISADGNTAIVGGPADNPNGTQGAAWIYTRANGVWTQQGSKLAPADEVAPGNVGWSVALSADGNTALIGAANDNTNQYNGAAWIFTRSNGSWTEQQKLVGLSAQGSPHQGFSVALSGDGKTAVIGGPGDSGGAGAAWIFSQKNGSWTQQQKLTVSGATGIAQAGFSVAISGDGSTIIMGGPTDDTVSSYAQGAAWVFTLNNNTWTQQGPKLVGRAPFMSQQGYSVAVSYDGNTAALGAPVSGGGAFVFARSNGVWTWQAGPLASPKGSTQSGDGNSVALSGDGKTIVVGGPGDNDAWVYTLINTTGLCPNQNSTTSGCWTLLQELTLTPPPDGATELASTWTGFSAAMSNDGSTIILGGPKDSTPTSSNLGAAWVFAAGAKLVTATAGTPQAAVPGAAFATNLKVTVTESHGYPVSGVTVSFTAPSSGASGTFAGSSLTATAVSDASGSAQAPVFTANNIVGSYAVIATGPGVSSPATFNLTNSGSTSAHITLQTSPPNLLVSFDSAPFAPAPVTMTFTVGSAHIIATQSPQPGNGGTQNYFASWSDGLALSHTINVPASDTTYTASFQNSGSAPTGQFTQQGSKLVGSGATGANSFQGYSVAISADGNTAIVGAPQDGPTSAGTSTNPRGAAWVWMRSNGTWSQQQKLTVSDGVAGQLFGFSVGLSADGNTAIIGGPGNPNNGGAWIFTRSNGAWTESQKLSFSGQAVTIDDGIGSSVAISGDGITAIVGAPAHSSNYGGAFVFARSGATTWIQQAQLEGTNVRGSQPLLGNSVGLSNDGNTAIIGAPDATPNGGFLIFTRSGSAWTQQGALLTVSSGTGTAPGEAVALSGDGKTAIAGIPNNQSNPAGAMVFGLANGAWTQQPGALSTPPSGTPEYLSNYVSLSTGGDVAVVGAPAADTVVVFVRVGGTWSAKGQLTPSGGIAPSAFGISAAISGDGSTLIIGGPADNNSAGAAWIFTTLSSSQIQSNGPTIYQGGIVPLGSSVSMIQSGSWVSIFGTNLASQTAAWNGDFPKSLAGTSVTINNKPAYLSFVGPNQINLQAPDDTTTGPVSVVVTTPGGTATSTVTLAAYAPSFALVDGKHVAGIITHSDGTYDFVGPTGTSLGYPTVAAKAGDIVTIFGVGFGPTNPAVPAGMPFSGSAPTVNSVQLTINKTQVTPTYSGMTSAGLYQLNFQVPAGASSGDVPLQATVGGARTPSGVVLSLQ